MGREVLKERLRSRLLWFGCRLLLGVLLVRRPETAQLDMSIFPAGGGEENLRKRLGPRIFGDSFERYAYWCQGGFLQRFGGIVIFGTIRAKTLKEKRGCYPGG